MKEREAFLKVTENLILKICVDEKVLLKIDFVDKQNLANFFDFYTLDTHMSEQRETPIMITVISQLQEYFLGQRKVFNLQLKEAHTPFLRAVQESMLQVPYGKTITYSQLAASAGSPKAVRAVGLACRNNHIAIVVPCHRIIGKNGKLTGYAGGLDIKQFLLDLETKQERLF